MNTTKIKTYAIQARRDFIKAVTERANIYGIFSDDHIEPIAFKGDMAIIGERAFPKKEGELREKLVGRIKRDGFSMSMRACAYTWFNRFVALRYMEIHDYLEHGYQVLSNNGGAVIPEILEHATDVEFQGLDKDKVIELKLAGTKDNELYRLLILAQCDHLHRSMPFLFDRIDTETELLLPDNLLHSDSPIRKLVNEIDESDWNDVEIIGWIYQFYISEKKDEVIGKVVKSEDIPAATQLFTPNWIVKYMVQNTLGRMWVATYQDSPLKDKMEYYIEPAAQEQEVQEQLNSITPKELNPEEITFLDPACGSGHILAEAYDLFKEIYLERGYRTRDIPRIILEKNLFGVDICDRAAQLAAFTVLMKARQDDRRILVHNNVKLNVLAIQEGQNSDYRNIEIFFKGNEHNETREVLKELVKLFENGKTFGSLITIPEYIVKRINKIKAVVNGKLSDWFQDSEAQNIGTLVEQAWILAKKYDCVVTNPPYMGSKGMNIKLKAFAKDHFPDSKSDLFAISVERIMELVSNDRHIGIMTPFTWMFLNSYEKLRAKILHLKTLTSLIRPEYHAFFESAYVPICTLTIFSAQLSDFKGIFIDLTKFYGAELQATKTLEAIKNPSCSWRHAASAADFKKIPGSPIAYWVSESFVNPFVESKELIHDLTISDGQTKTGDNDKYLRLHWEVSSNKVGSIRKWWQHPKGGPFRKWYGNVEWVIDWSEEARLHYRNDHVARILPEYLWGKRGISWTLITSSKASFRLLEANQIFNLAAPSLFFHDESNIPKCLGFLNTKYVTKLLKVINPTLNLNVGEVRCLPLLSSIDLKIDKINETVANCISISKEDWDSLETSWNFSRLPLIQAKLSQTTIEATYIQLQKHRSDMVNELRQLEQTNNRIFIEAYELQDELTPEVPLSEITLMCNPHYRYNGNKDKAELGTLLLCDTVKELISYSIGCMMGRYSLDHPGLIYAHNGNIDFDPSKYKTFPADDDGIIPIMDQDWFPDDATNRFVDFLKITWSPETLDENLKFVADSLKPKQNETPIETIRRYLSTSFFKDHLKTYKKRPIYWLFSSGKRKAFEGLVYLHRYHETTLSRMRSTYVTPLQSNISSRLEFLQDEKDAAATTSAKNKFQKEIDKLKKKQAELSKFDDELRHYADMKISLDLDDGVKVNYGKFGSLLAEKKAITGKK